EIMGSGQQQRCFTYIEDIADGIVTAGLHPKSENDDFNIGEDTPTTVEQLAHRIWELSGRSEPFQLAHTPALEHDIQRRIPDIARRRACSAGAPRYRSMKGYAARSTGCALPCLRASGG